MKIQFGMSRKCINPEVPVSLAGYFNRRMWDHVIDDIEVRALVLRDAKGHYGAFVHFDLLFVTHDLAAAFWKEAARRNVPHVSEGNTILAAIHTHTAPEIRTGGIGTNPAYFSMLIERAVSALGEAVQDCTRRGELESATTADARFQFNRRYWMKDGSVVTNPGKLNPAIVRPEGDIDPEIPFFAIRENGDLAVIVSSIVNHSDTTGGPGVSADWPGVCRRTMETYMQKAMTVKRPCMMLPLVGAEGNINHFDVSTKKDQTSHAEAERIGNGYAQTLTAALKDLKKIPGNTLFTVHTTVRTTVREIDPQELAQAKETIRKYPEIDVQDPKAAADINSEDLAKGAPIALKFFAQKLVDMADAHDRQEFPLTGIALGPELIVASLPSEPFTEIGLAVRKEIFPDRTCLITALAGTGSSRCSGGYIPNAWNYGRGGYETTPRSNPYSVHTAERLLAGWKKLAKKLR